MPVEDEKLGALGQMINGMSDEELHKLAASRAAPHTQKRILRPSEKQGQARSKVPEELAHLLARLYQGERSRRADESVPNSMNDKVFRQLESFCQQNSTTFVPFDMLAGLKDQGRDPQQVLSAAAIKLANAANAAQVVAYKGPAAAPEIMLEFGQMVFQMQRILNLFGWTFDDLKLNVRREIDIQEKEAKNKS